METSSRDTRTVNASYEADTEKIYCPYRVRGFLGDLPVGTRSMNASGVAGCSYVDLDFLISEGNYGGEALFGESVFELIFCCF